MKNLKRLNNLFLFKSYKLKILKNHLKKKKALSRSVQFQEKNSKIYSLAQVKTLKKLLLAITIQIMRS